MTKVEVVDDAGDEITEITIPIPFYVRVTLEDGTKRYRLRLIDDNGRVRGQYQGSTNRKYLEVHVPLIKLPKPGQLRILVEESTGHESFEQQHQVSVHYLPYKEETSQDNAVETEYTEKNELAEEETTLDEEKVPVSPPQQEDEIKEPTTDEEEKIIEDIIVPEEKEEPIVSEDRPTELTKEELEYLEQRKRILNNGLYEFDEEE